jgi:hypothetical protein
VRSFVLATGYNVILREVIIGEWEQLKKKQKQALVPGTGVVYPSHRRSSSPHR